MNDILKQLLARGLRLLPVRAKGKIPTLPDWPKRASNDKKQIVEWLEADPDCNWGAAMGAGSGYIGLDVDPRNGGLESLAALEFTYGPIPRDWTHETPSGGEHIILKRPAKHVPNSAGKLGPGLDIRGDGGQIVIPPSTTEKGAYKILSFGEAPDCPEWLAQLICAAPIAITAPAERETFPPATPEIIAAYRAALQALGPAIQGQGGDDRTWRAAAIGKHDFALTDDEAWPPLLEWNATCQPIWSERDLRAKLRGGAKYAKFAYGERRELDNRALVRKWCSAYNLAPSQAALDLLLDKCRLIEWTDQAHRESAEKEIKGVTRLSTKAIGLRVVKRVAPKQRTPYELSVSSSGAPHCNLANAETVVNAEEIGVYYDEFSHRLERDETGKEWDDQDDRELQIRMQRDLDMPKMQTETVRQAIIHRAMRRPRNTLREYLERLTWDGTRRLHLLFINGFGAEDNVYTRAASANFLRSLAARGLRPGCKVDTMPVLEGLQGKKKSTGLRALVGDKFFMESSEDPKHKDFYISIQGKWLVEVAEMDSFSRADVSAVKRILSCQSDRYRPPYARTAQDHPRSVVFAGSTNRDDWQRDDTGARRFWPVWCTAVNVGWIAENRDQLFAEAVADVSAYWSEKDRGVETPTTGTWWDMPAEETLAEQDARRPPDAWAPAITQHLASSAEPLTAAEIATAVLQLPLGMQDDRVLKRIGSVLRAIGATKRRARIRGSAHFHNVWELTASPHPTEPQWVLHDVTGSSATDKKRPS